MSRAHEGGRDGLFAFAVALLAQPDGRSLGVEVAVPQVQGAFAASAGLEMEPQHEEIEVGVVAGGANSADQLAEPTATAVRLRAGTDSADVRVAVPPALIATKAHALRLATGRRRATKRSSDLYDLYRLVSFHLPKIADGLASARWNLRGQVTDTLAHDLADVEQALAVLRAAPPLAPVDSDDFLDVITELLDQLSSPRA